MRREQRGQTLTLMALGVGVLVGAAGLSIDVGDAYVVRAQLQNAARAAALAGAAYAFYPTDSGAAAKTAALAYSASSGDLNAVSNLGSVTTTAAVRCLSSLLTKGSTCSSSTSPINAIRVTEQTSVKTYFMALFGVKTLTVGAVATATMGGTVQPWNVAIILDATSSMNTTDSYCNDVTAEKCAMTGIQTLLGSINPCLGSTASCSASSSNSIFRVSLFTFPNVTTSQIAYDYNCGGTPTGQPYTLPAILSSTSTSGYSSIQYSGSGGYNPSFTGTYESSQPNAGGADANGFYSDYYSSSASSHLNSGSYLVKMVGNGSTLGCIKPRKSFKSTSTCTAGICDGVTYFAGAIYAAQAALQAEKSVADALTGLSSKNAIIFISDGQANTGSNRFPYYNGSTSVSSNGVFAMNDSSLLGTYPSSYAPCQQAMMAALWAKQAGTRVYGIAYGSETDGCADSSIVLSSADRSSLNVYFSSISSVVPCLTVQNIASDLEYFYTDGSSNANGCTTTTNTGTSLNSIFSNIVPTFSTAPENFTPALRE
jgi:Flp pilus assembly protein TadG